MESWSDWGQAVWQVTGPEMTWGKKNILKLQEKSQGMILREHKPLFHGQIKNSLTRRLISGLKVSFLKGGMVYRGDGRRRKVESVCILGFNCATNLWCAFEEVTSHLSAYFQSVKQSI